MARYEDLTGKKYGRLTVLMVTGRTTSRAAIWQCLCDCGKAIDVSSVSLKSGNTKSCGCIVKKHMSTETRLYNIYMKMKSRCENPKADQYRYYGEKGIKVCHEWKAGFIAFQKWALENGYADNLTIDRRNVKGDYEPLNCQWITASENIVKMHKDKKTDGLPTGIYLRNYGGDDRYIAYSHAGCKTEYLGTFKTPEDAIAARSA